jgi:hypothetical protein
MGSAKDAFEGKDVPSIIWIGGWRKPKIGKNAVEPR